MSKKKTTNQPSEEATRQSRKEVLLARKQAQQTRQLRIAMSIVGVLIGLVLLTAVINEFFIAPNRSVASVGADNISLREFEDRVRFERARRIVVLEDQLAAFDGDVGIIQQFASQLLIDLFPNNAEAFGEGVLNQMVDETLLQQEAEARGIVISEADVEAEIGRSFNYFDGGLPTPFPTATATMQPTPSLTPLPTAVITELLPTTTPFPTPTVGPTNTPFPTATPVTAESFQEQFDELLADYRQLGIEDASFRESIRLELLQDRLADALAEERELSREAEHANFFLLAFDNEAEAEEVATTLTADNFLEVWNGIRSQSFDAQATSTAQAVELFRRTESELGSTFTPEFAAAIFETPLNTPTAVFTLVGEDGSRSYFIASVSGRELLPLSDSAFDALKQELLVELLAELREGNVVINNFWRSRVPTTPALDNKFFAEPTAAAPIEQTLPELPLEVTPAP